jgi:hypothetical protein
MKISRDIHESVFAKTLCESFKEFKEFYENERNDDWVIEWRVDSYLPFKLLGAEAATITDTTKKIHKVCLPKYPVDLIDSIIVGHEIMHIKFYEDGSHLFLYRLNKRCNDLLNFFGTFLEDYAADSFLHNTYHFDLTKDYVRHLSIAKNLTGKCIEPPKGLWRLENATYLANDIIKWTLIEEPNALLEWTKFLENYNEGCPETYAMSQTMAKIAQRTNGLDTIDKRRATFSEIDEKYNLREFINMENKFSRDQ